MLKKHFSKSLLCTIFIGGLVIGCLSSTTEESSSLSNQPEILSLFPSIDKWRASPATILDSSETIYLQTQYKSYGFIRQADAIYHIYDNPIKVSILEMNSSESAYGIWSDLRYEGCNSDSLFVRDNFSGTYSMNFWKDRYYIHIQRYDRSDLTKSVIKQLAMAINNAIEHSLAAIGEDSL